ncbi:MAG: cytochrome c biogenesis protein CcdA, partial [Planctomycetota bacterium]
FGMGQGEAKVTASFAADSVASGDVVDLHVQFEITDGWHIYHPDQDENGAPTTVSVSGTGVEIAGELQSLQEPKVHEISAGNFHATYLWLEGSPEFVLPVRITGPVGTAQVKVSTGFMICDESVCLAADSRDFELSIQLTEGTGESEDAVASGGQEEEVVVADDPHNGQEYVEDKEDVTFDKVSVEFSIEGNVAEGETVDLIFDLDVAEGWHVYDPKQDPMDGIPPTVVLSGAGMTLVERATTTSEPVSHVERFGSQETQYWWQSGKLQFRAKLRFDGPVPEDAKVRLLYQACDANSCLLPEQRTYALASYSTTGAGGLPTGFWGFMLAAISAGLLTLLTPCVFPMIPVTISYFTKRAETGKGTPLGNATAYAGGIIFTFAGIGVGAALALGAGGANAIGSNPWVNMGIGVLFVVMAISLLGFFEIQAPRFLQNFASKTQSEGQSKAGYLPVALMAIAFSITAFTCTVGFVGAVFALGLQLGLVYLVGGMFVYGLVFALPFFFLALLPSKLQSLPTAGGWMNTVKVCAGFVELLAAIKFFSNTDLVWELEILTWPVVLAASTIIMLLWGSYMLGFYKLPYDYERPKPGKRRIVFGVLILATGLWLAPGIFNRDYNIRGLVAYMPPKHYGLHQIDEETGLIVGPADLTWYEHYETAFDAAKDEGRPLFIDFTGVTCVNCRLMENGVFPTDEVKPLLEQFTRVELWVDKEPEYLKMQSERYTRVSQPFYVLLDPRDDSVLATYDGYDPDPSKFAVFLQKGLDGYTAE